MKDMDHVFALLQDIKDMLVGLSILLAGLLAALFLGSPLGRLAFWIAIILAVAGLGVVWQGRHGYKALK